MTSRLSFGSHLGCAASAAIVVSCGTSIKHAPQSRVETSVERFVSILERGDSLYGVGAGCTEWTAHPGTGDEDENAGGAAARGVQGHLGAREPDDRGRIYGFSYRLIRNQDLVRLRISGRGSWSPAPGVIIRDPTNSGLAVIGSGTYCTVEVEVRASGDDSDAIVVGNETWFLSADACSRARDGRSATSRGCSDTGRRR